MNKNPYAKMEDFVSVVTDKNAMQIFLLIAKTHIRKIDQIIEDTSLDPKDVALSIDKLEKGNFIVRNPSLMSQKFRLGFNGQLFAEQLRIEFPEVRKLLGDRVIIEPIRAGSDITLSAVSGQSQRV